MLSLIALSPPCLALTAPGPDLRLSHDLSQHEDGSFTINGSDAYIVLPIDNTSPASTQESALKQAEFQELSFELSFDLPPVNSSDSSDQAPAAPKLVPVELFFNPVFKTRETGENEPEFNPFKRIKFNLEKKAEQLVVLRLPTNVKIERTAIRVDIDACLMCQIRFGSLAVLRPLSLSTTVANTTEVDQFRIFNGLNKIPKQGLALDIKSWQLNDLQQFEDLHLEVTGIDPFIVSPALDNDVADLGGVYFDLDVPSTVFDIIDFQLFYSTEHHQFIEAASSLIRISPVSATENRSNSGRLRFFVPMDFLGKQARPAKLLKRLRLDFANSNYRNFSNIAIESDLDRANASPKWRVNEVKLVSTAQVDMFAALTPAQLLHTTRASNSGTQTMLNIFKKIFSDLWFTVLYSLLLIGVILLTIRKFRATTRPN